MIERRNGRVYRERRPGRDQLPRLTLAAGLIPRGITSAGLPGESVPPFDEGVF